MPEPVASASSARPGHDAAAAHDGDPDSFWWSGAGDAMPWFALDFLESREYGGLVLDWATGRQAADYAVEASDDGSAWRELRTVHGGNGRRDYLYLPESESRYLRVRALDDVGGYGAGLAEVAVMPLEWSASRAAFFEAMAKDAPRGSFPRGIGGEQVYWTVVGADGDAREGLLSEDGMLETGKGSFSIEPFLYLNGSLITWADVQPVQSLEGGSLPIPSVTWSADDLELTITAFAVGEPGASSMIARYRVLNRGARRVNGGLFLAIRPFQVNPPSQFLNMPGGFAPIREIEREGRVIRVNGDREDRLSHRALELRCDSLRPGRRGDRLPSRRQRAPVHRGARSLRSRLGGLGLHARSRSRRRRGDRHPGASLRGIARAAEAVGSGRKQLWVAEQFARSRAAWESTEDRVVIEVPDIAKPAIESLRSQLGYILVNRAGPAIQPGTRSYARSWIRDGALTSSALLRLGHPEPVKEFITWYAPHQYENGKVPCVVDSRGADPVPEHDSSGEFIFLVAEYWRYTRDDGASRRDDARACCGRRRIWIRCVTSGARRSTRRRTSGSSTASCRRRSAMRGTRPSRCTPTGTTSGRCGDSRTRRFWPRCPGSREDAARLGAIRAEFAADLAASIQAAMRRHGIDYVPGCADLGDFDATSTTIALSPTEARSVAPPGALENTFERYYTFFRDRANGAPWDAFTPYEIRNLGAFVRLGWRDRAQELLAFFLAYQKPVGWRQWPEVVWHDARTPHFLGDLPHTWCGSDYVRSMLDMLAYVDESAGCPGDRGRGSRVVARPRARGGGEEPAHPLRTACLRDDRQRQARSRCGWRRASAFPPGASWCGRRSAGRPAKVTIDGRAVAPEPNGDVIVRALPATVLIRR